MQRLSATFALSASLFLAACAGSLKVYDAQQNEIKGMPFRAAEVYVKLGTHDKLAKGGACDPTAFVDTLSLPTGAQYYVTATSSSFAKTAFHVKYTDAGTVSEVGLDSEPAAAESIKATNELLKTVIPVLGLGVAAAAAVPGAAARPACDAGEANVKLVKLDDYVAGRVK